MSTIVQKFGGACLATPEKVRDVAAHLSRLHAQGHRVVAIVSAMGKSTDELIRLAYQVSPHPNRRELDMLLTTGERVSSSTGICLASIDPDNIKPFTELLPRRTPDVCVQGDAGAIAISLSIETAENVPTQPVGPTPPKVVDVGFQLPPTVDGPQTPIIKTASPFPGNEIIDPPRIVEIRATQDCGSI
jgi:hypothetical protein